MYSRDSQEGAAHQHDREVQIPGGGFWSYRNQHYYFIDRKGILHEDLFFDQVQSYHFGRAAVAKEGKWGFVDCSGRLIVSLEFDLVFEFRTQVTVGIKKRTGYLFDTSGRMQATIDSLDYFHGFEAGRAKLTRGQQEAFIDTTGHLVVPWNRRSGPFSRPPSRPVSPLSEGFCPTNFDFGSCDFTNWTSYIGSVGGGLQLSPSPAVNNRQTILQRGSGFDPYGGFELSPPDSSICAVRLGNNRNGAEAERLEYRIQIPPTVNDYTFMYQYALVFEDPGHPRFAQPKFKVEMFDEATGQLIACASVDYEAGYGGASFFSTSPVNSRVKYKPWTAVFINLGRYRGSLRITFTTMDCAYGGHWCYAYFDINSCDYSGVSANNSCTIPNTTTLAGPPGFTSYNWSLSPNLTPSLGTTRDIVLPPPGIPSNTTVYVQLIPENGAACSDTLNVKVLPFTAKAIFTSQPPQCLKDNNFSFRSLSRTNGGTFTSLVWDFGDGNSETGSPVSHQYARADTFSVKLTATTSEGCVDDTTLRMVVLPSPALRVSGTNICEGQIALVTLTGGDGYTWNPRSGVSFTSPLRDSAYFNLGNTSNYTITAINNSSGCMVDTNIRINYYPMPLADFTQPAPQCLRNNRYVFANTSTYPGNLSGVNFEWDFGDANSSNDFSTQHHYDTAGVYQVRLFASSPDGCRDTIQKPVVVYAHPSSNIFASGPLRFCENDSVILRHVGNSGSGPIVSYQWFSDGNLISGWNQPRRTFYQSSDIRLVVVNDKGCTDTSLMQPVIMHPLPQATLSPAPAGIDFVCDGSVLELKANQSTATRYQWYYTDLNQSYPPVPIPGADSSSYFANKAGRYSVLLSTSTSPVCTNYARDTLVLQLIKQPIPDFSFPVYCAGLPIPIRNQSNTQYSGPVRWNWDFGDLTPGSTEQSPTHTYYVGTNYPVSLTITPEKCPQLDTGLVIPLRVEEPVPGIRYPPVNAVKFSDMPLQARTFAPICRWQPRIGLVNGNYSVHNPVFNYGQLVDYTIRLETTAGCVTVDSQLVRIFERADIQVPTAFSPNGDGHNDRLDVFLIGIAEFRFVKIFNRWGQLLYESNDPTKKWDGTFKTVKQPCETYVWIAEAVDFERKPIVRRGQFILLR